MGLLSGEGRLLRDKYMKKYGITQYEAVGMVSKFVDELDAIKYNMKSIKKSKAEIKLKEQEIFQEEFMKLCAE